MRCTQCGREAETAVSGVCLDCRLLEPREAREYHGTEGAADERRWGLL